MADDEAIRLLEEALHLRQNGERAPGGTETWAHWEREAEAFLRTERHRAFRASLREPVQWSPAEAESIRRAWAANRRAPDTGPA